jgi:hypothetical protein
MPRGQRSWAVDAPVVLGQMSGFIGAPGGERLIDGYGAILHRVGDDPPGLRGTVRTTILIAGDGLSIGVDQAGSQALAWAVVGGLNLESTSALLVRKGGGRYTIDLRPDAPVSARIKTRKRRVETGLYREFLPGEKLLLDSWIGTPIRRMRAADAVVTLAGTEVIQPAVVLEIVYK